MEYYHLVTREAMFVGQVIDFTQGQKNRLFDFWMSREDRTKDGRDVFDIVSSFDYQEGWCPNQEERDVLAGYITNQSRAVRETIAELVRMQHFPQRPSRLSSLYVSQSMEEVLNWKENFEGNRREILQLVALTTDGPVFTGDASLLPGVNGDSFEKKMEQAYRYWTGERIGVMEETLISGKITVKEIVEDYRLF